ncbi:MAG: hypothetical protein ACLPR9_13195 [Acidimicrobiales bacterium]|jgi:hypothetical protein
MDQVHTEQTNSGQVDQVNADHEDLDRIDVGRANQVNTEGHDPTPGDVLRTLPSEAEQRGTRFVSAQAMQAKLFSVYDAAAAAEDALALVQQQLTLTLNRNYYEADEIESMAAQLDSLLTLESLDLTERDLVSED